MSNKIIALWSPPRSISTAFLRSFKQRGDFVIFNEAFCDIATNGVYPCAHNNKELKSNSEVIDLISSYAQSTPVFFKETCEASFLDVLKYKLFMKSVTHTFLVRDPKATIHSHYHMNNNVTCEEIGYQNLLEVIEYVKFNLKQDVVIIDSESLIEKPEETLKLYCDAAGVEFKSSALSWEPGNIPEWKRTETWHRDVSESSGIHKRQNSYEVTIDNNSTLRSYYNYHKPIYDKIMEYKSN
ncbi:hypothetical protein MHO82_25120 [Vibrio sp. Of7-15]|uniref:sulfotransferase-like domain-containing protein n=1 Tax=Vibrio sp. Of7-15 TaxID=2724879 RepID=UPI001EF34704|nr:hypothetical protein [Vibrio sp. Of7-15]MCG7500148.1 hypothetical protein [Vibrio sp. Of7-15]